MIGCELEAVVENETGRLRSPETPQSCDLRK